MKTLEQYRFHAWHQDMMYGVLELKWYQMN